MPRYEIHLVSVDDNGNSKVVDTFDVSAPKPSQSGKLNMHAGGKVVLNGDRWQFGTNITRIGAPTGA
jgi:hypothetical protein